MWYASNMKVKIPLSLFFVLSNHIPCFHCIHFLPWASWAWQRCHNLKKQNGGKFFSSTFKNLIPHMFLLIKCYHARKSWNPISRASAVIYYGSCSPLASHGYLMGYWITYMNSVAPYYASRLKYQGGAWTCHLYSCNMHLESNLYPLLYLPFYIAMITHVFISVCS